MPGRNMHRAWPILALLAAALGGCSGDFSAFSFGKRAEPPAVEPNLFPTKYRSDVADFMRTYLANPTKVKEAFIAEPALRPVAGIAHYITCVRYNARNGSNQYEGTKTDLAIFLGGRINQFLPGDAQMCAGLNYQRYPEIEDMVP